MLLEDINAEVYYYMLYDILFTNHYVENFT
jgi:hypothetical protein